MVPPNKGMLCNHKNINLLTRKIATYLSSIKDCYDGMLFVIPFKLNFCVKLLVSWHTLNVS